MCKEETKESWEKFCPYTVEELSQNQRISGSSGIFKCLVFPSWSVTPHHRCHHHHHRLMQVALVWQWFTCVPVPGTSILLCLAFIEAVCFSTNLREISFDINSSRKTNRRDKSCSRNSSDWPLVTVLTELKIPAQPLPKGGTLNKLQNCTNNLFCSLKRR